MNSMSKQAKYGWAIGLIMAGIVGAVPFRHQPTSTSEVASNTSGEVASAGVEPGGEVEKSSNRKSDGKTERQKSATKLSESSLLPGNSRMLEPFDVQSRAGSVVEQVPRKFARDEVPDSAVADDVGTRTSPEIPLDGGSTGQPRDNRIAERQPVPKPQLQEQFTQPRRQMPRDVGPYRMKPVPSRFQPASQSANQSAPDPSFSEQSFSTPRRSRKVIHYKLRDGDTLRSIAQRYLGDANRSGEILADNRHLLTNGENFLPIGQFITIIIQ